MNIIKWCFIYVEIQVCRCKVKDLAVTAKENGITKTALIVVGEVLGGEKGEGQIRWNVLYVC